MTIDVDAFDFGFTLVNEEDLEVSTVAEIATEKVGDVEDRLNKLYNMIQPLLNKLKSDPSKDLIKWPGELRLQQIEEFSDLIDKVYTGQS